MQPFTRFARGCISQPCMLRLNSLLRSIELSALGRLRRPRARAASLWCVGLPHCYLIVLSTTPCGRSSCAGAARTFALFFDPAAAHFFCLVLFCWNLLFTFVKSDTLVFCFMSKTVSIVNTAVPTKSVSGLAAQSSIVLQAEVRNEYQKFIQSMCSVAKNYRGLSLSVAVDLLLTNGLRVSELLRLRVDDVMANGAVYSRSSKGSRDRQVFLSQHSCYDLLLVARDGLIMGGVSRFYMYRSLRAIGLTYQVAGGQRRSVTHAGRHLFALSLKDGGFDIECIANVLGHKSLKSTSYYVR